MIYTGSFCFITNTVELDTGDFLDKLVKVVDIAGIVDQPGQRQERIIRLEPSSLININIYIPTDMSLIRLCTTTMRSSSLPLS